MTDYLVDRPGKDAIRKELFAERGLLDCVLTLPSTEFQCLQRGFEANAFHDDTHFIIAEYDKKKAKIIRDTWHKYIPFGHVHFHEGDLFNLDLSKLPKIDVAYVDLEGCVNIDELVWLHNILAQHINRNGVVAVTHAPNRAGIVQWLGATQPMIVNNWTRAVRDKLGTKDLSPLDCCTYDLLLCALGFGGSSKVERYCDTSAMRAYVFEKTKTLPIAEEIWKKRQRLFDDYKTTLAPNSGGRSDKSIVSC